MTIKQINIKNRGTLTDFTAEFGPVTVIYGPNASGKSLLSNTLRAIELPESLRVGSANVTFTDGTKLNSVDFERGEYANRVRVFNAGFLRNDVIDRNPSAIELGRELRDNLSDIERTKRSLEKLNRRKAKQSDRQTTNERSMDNLLESTGREIKLVLRRIDVGNANRRWPYYGKGDARGAFQTMLNDNSVSRHARSQKRLEELSTLIRQRPSNELPHLSVDDPGVADYRNRASGLLSDCPESSPLSEAESDPDRRNWLRLGREYLLKDPRCAFCCQVVPPDRASAIHSYFSDSMTQLLDNIDEMMAEGKRKSDVLANVRVVSLNELRHDLQDDYQGVDEQWRLNVERTRSAIATIVSQLKTKRERPSKIVEPVADLPAWDAQAVAEVNRFVDQHNQSVTGLLPLCHEYEMGFIASRFDEWSNLEDEANRLKAELKEIDSDTAHAQVKLNELRTAADSKLIAANQLTDMVSSFLGHDEIGFNLNEGQHTYQLTRGGEPATDFSEGERTALGLMYFFKRLEDREFARQPGTIVFDDPITSFDEDNLIRAMSEIISRTGRAPDPHHPQLRACNVVILTHHFGVLERLWMEFRNQRDKGSAQFYELRCRRDANGRHSQLFRMENSLIADFQLAFDEVATLANECNPDINNPENSIRKCLEGFLLRVAPDIDAADVFTFRNRYPDVKVPTLELQNLKSVVNSGSHASRINRPANTDKHRKNVKVAAATLRMLMSGTVPSLYMGMESLRKKRLASPNTRD